MISVITPTHNPRYLREAVASVRAQTYSDWEMVIYPNGKAASDNRVYAELRQAVEYGSGDQRDKVKLAERSVSDRRRVKIAVSGRHGSASIGQIKREAFMLGRGDILVELDHDDILTANALEEIAAAFADPEVDFVYSNFADFDNSSGEWVRYPNWERNGWRYRDNETVQAIEMRRSANCVQLQTTSCVSFKPSATSISSIAYAPNHVRAWRASFYKSIGGHDPAYAVGDDHELLIRTYLRGRMKHIDKCLYLYRMSEANTFTKRGEEIIKMSTRLDTQHLESLLEREGKLRKLPCVDLDWTTRAGWERAERAARAIKEGEWCFPYPNSSVMAFRMFELAPNARAERRMLAEIHRCLVPGGTALVALHSDVYLRSEVMPRFMEKFVFMPGQVNDLIAWKPGEDMSEVPGVRPA